MSDSGDRESPLQAGYSIKYRKGTLGAIRGLPGTTGAYLALFGLGRLPCLGSSSLYDIIRDKI